MHLICVPIINDDLMHDLSKIYNFFLFKVCFIFVYLSMSIESQSCKTGNSHPKRGNIKYYRNHYSFIKEDNPNPTASGSSNTPSGLTQGTPGTSNCRWTWDTDNDTTRKPASIAIAKCTNCDLNKCRAIIYNHNVLVEQKDCKTGEMVRTWATEALPVAFVYDV